MTIIEICSFVRKKFPFYGNQISKTWENSLKGELCSFVKIPKTQSYYTTQHYYNTSQHYYTLPKFLLADVSSSKKNNNLNEAQVKICLYLFVFTYELIRESLFLF